MNFADFFAGLHGGAMPMRLPPPPSDEEVAELYGRLDLEPDAEPSAIKKAYRKAAVRNHPDRGGDPVKFQHIQEAYDILGDDDKRTVFLRCGYRGLEAGLSAEDVDPAARRRREMKPPDLKIAVKCGLGDLLTPLSREVEVERLVVEHGSRRRETTRVHINIPASAPDGFPLRLMESGHIVDGVPGDVLVRLSVMDHPLFERRGPDLFLQQRISLRQAVCGFIFPVPMLEGGALRVAVPPGRALGSPVVLPGYGLPLSRSGVAGGRGAIVMQFGVTMRGDTPGFRLSQQLADLAWEELKPHRRRRRRRVRRARDENNGDDEGDEEEEVSETDSDDDGEREEQLELPRYTPEAVAAAEVEAREEEAKDEDAEAERAHAHAGAKAKAKAAGAGEEEEARPPKHFVEAPFESLRKEDMTARYRTWAANCGAERMEEEYGHAGGGHPGAQVVQCGQQ
mmetsp:Transcript_5934/g.18887  ORF Transcript_5934/g.18887 Transcript_5934/m.18887 type:complete len:453 (-) Transcript_5934:19-1377(-)